MNSIEETELSDFRRQIETNLFGTIIVTKAAIPIMRQQRAGHIIQFSSVGGRIGAPGTGRPEYDEVVGAAARIQRAYNGRQPGDPARAAQVILKIAAMERPPFRLPLGSDAVKAIEQADRSRLDELQRWRELSLSTDFPEDEDRD